MFSAFFRDLRTEFAGYNADKLLKDVMAGLTVCAVALPLALAFGVSSGASAAAGLVTAILAGIVIAILGGASYQVSGPTGAMSAVLIGIVAQYGLQGVFFACFAAGVLLLAAGLLKLGRLIGFIPMPVIMGFTSGIAIIIALGQVDNFFGTVSEGSSNLEKLASYARLGFHPNLQTVLIGALVVAVMLVWPKKWGAKIPGSLIGIIAATALAAVLDLDELAVVGDIPRTLLLSDRLHLGSLSLDMLSDLISPVVTIAALGMIESLLCGASAARMKSEPFHADQELIAQGVGNILLPFFGGVPATAAIARTSVAIKSGQQTRLTSVFHSVFLLASMFLLGGVMARLPLSALAGVLMVTAWRMNDWAGIRYIFAHRFKSAISQFLVTMLATVVFDLTVAIILGVIYSAMPYALHYLEAYHARYPKVEFYIRLGSPQDLLNDLDRGELHVLFLRRSTQESGSLHERILGEDALELIMTAATDPAPELDAVPIERLRGVPMCLLRSDDLWGYNDYLMKECRRSGFEPNVPCQCYDTPMAMQLVRSGFGISFLPHSIVETQPNSGIYAKPLRGIPAKSYPVLVWSDDVLGAPCVQRFIAES